MMQSAGTSWCRRSQAGSWCDGCKRLLKYQARPEQIVAVQGVDMQKVGGLDRERVKSLCYGQTGEIVRMHDRRGWRDW